MSDFDLLIRGGTVADGTGAPLRTADVAVKDGRIAAVGQTDDSADRVIDADGALVTPGFVDIHTHYDGQVTWDSFVAPSSWHGVTTVVMGNCGVGFAPVREHDRDRLVELMEGVEDIPGAALHEGLTWEWEHFNEFLDAIARRPHDIDVAAQVPHGAVRLYVMGDRGANREPATAEEIAAMGAVVRDAVRAGALGFTTSRTLNHRTSRGEPTPTLTAAEDELVGIARVMGEAGTGVFEVVSDFIELDTEFDRFRHMVEASGRPLTFSLAQADVVPDNWRQLLERIERAQAEGVQIKAQVAARAIGVLLGLQATLNPFLTLAAYREIHDRPLAERVLLLRDPQRRQRIMAEVEAAPKHPFFAARFERMFPLGDPPDYEPPAADSVAARAEREGRRPADVAYDLLLEDEGRAFLYFPFLNYTDGNLDNIREMLLHDFTVPGLGDGGAHVGTICDGSFPTTLLTHWGRDRPRGGLIDVPYLVKSQTRDTAMVVGLSDRGVLAEGAKGDVNVIDFDRLTLHAPEMHFDLPAGGKRLLQRADGYRHTIVSGEVVYDDGEHTGALPGQLLRGAR